VLKIEVNNINGKTESLYVYGDYSILSELEALSSIVEKSKHSTLNVSRTG
jgi:hypothetical protein